MSRVCIQATWQDAPHLSEKQKADLYAAIPPYQRDARTKGIPQLGSGAIYQIPESEIIVDPFELPAYFRRAFALDVGWNHTAALWGALDPDTDILYLYSEHYRGQAEPEVHAHAIRQRGEWIPGVIDPAARGRQQKDGDRLLSIYRDELGLPITPANNAREAGIYAVTMRLSTGRLKVFRSLTSFLSEYRIYRRDDKGQIVKENDHLMDACRYLIMSGLQIAADMPTSMWGGRLVDMKGTRLSANRSSHQVEFDPFADAYRLDR